MNFKKMPDIPFLSPILISVFLFSALGGGSPERKGLESSTRFPISPLCEKARYALAASAFGLGLQVFFQHMQNFCWPRDLQIRIWLQTWENDCPGFPQITPVAEKYLVDIINFSNHRPTPLQLIFFPFSHSHRLTLPFFSPSLWTKHEIST
jgi:hypothetical protein